MGRGTKILLWSILILVLVTLLPIGEILLIKYLAGMDILAHLNLTFEEGKTMKLVFEGGGVIAFIVAQPFALVFFFGRISRTVGDHVTNFVSFFVKP